MKFENLYNLCGGLKFLVLFVGFSVCFSIFFFIKREKKDGDVFVSFVIGILIMIFFSGFLFILDNMVDYIGFIFIIKDFFFVVVKWIGFLVKVILKVLVYWFWFFCEFLYKKYY